jgi:hypothetical protein
LSGTFAAAVELAGTVEVAATRSLPVLLCVLARVVERAVLEVAGGGGGWR